MQGFSVRASLLYALSEQVFLGTKDGVELPVRDTIWWDQFCRMPTEGILDAALRTSIMWEVHDV